MIIIRRDDGFWIVGGPPGVDSMGPYPKLSEAQEDRDGVARFLRNETRRSYFTTSTAPAGDAAEKRHRQRSFLGL